MLGGGVCLRRWPDDDRRASLVERNLVDIAGAVSVAWRKKPAEDARRRRLRSALGEVALRPPASFAERLRQVAFTREPVKRYEHLTGLCFLLGGFSGYVSCAVSYERIHSGVIAPISLQERVDISMADSSIKEQRALYAQVALETPEVLNALIADLEGSSRRKRQAAASTLSVAASMKPEVLTEFSNVFVDALNRPEAQTRWECLDILTSIVGVESRLCDKAIPGAESALFDEDSGPLHLAAMRFLCRLGSTTENRSQKVWPLIDEAIQCYHGDIEFQEMLVAVIAFSEGKLADEVVEELKSRMAFDAKSGRGVLKKRAAQIVENLS